MSTAGVWIAFKAMFQSLPSHGGTSLFQCSTTSCHSPWAVDPGAPKRILEQEGQSRCQMQMPYCEIAWHLNQLCHGVHSCFILFFPSLSPVWFKIVLQTSSRVMVPHNSWVLNECISSCSVVALLLYLWDGCFCEQQSCLEFTLQTYLCWGRY